MPWKLTQVCKKIPKLNEPVFIEGLPGIGNVGKVAVDFILDQIKAVKVFDLFSHSFPHSVFVNENNLVELPSISIYLKQRPRKQDLIFLTGDIQPVDEVSSYEFCEMILELCKKFNVKEIITLGGVGLQNIPKKPKVYCTGNEKSIIKRFKKDVIVDEKLYGVVGPIIGATGLLLGLGKKQKLPAIGLLAETFAHPMFLGILGAKEIIKILDKKFALKLNMKKLNKEIKELEIDMLKRSEELSKVSRNTALKRLTQKEVNYIG